MKSELLKLRYSRLTWVIGVALLLMMAGGHAIVIGLPYFIPWMIGMNEIIPNFTGADRMSDAQLARLSFENTTAQWQVADIAGSSTGLIGAVTTGVVLLAALATTAEYRYDSISLTVQLEPRRGRVLAEKWAALVVLTTVLTAALVALSAVALCVGTLVSGAALAIPVPDLLLAWLGSWLALILVASVGFGVGLLLRGQLISIAVLLGVALLESILRPISSLLFGGPTILSALPFGLAYDVTAHANILTGERIPGFPSGAALVMLLIWAAVIVLGAGVVFRRRDVVGRA